MTNEFHKILDLIKKTGDRIIFYDSSNDSSFIILPLAEYEKLVLGKSEVEIKRLTKEELSTRINRDIVQLRPNQNIEKSEIVGEILADELNNQAKKTEENEVGEEVYEFEPIEEENNNFDK